MGHIAIFDHPENEGFPAAWRVDGQLGVGPVRERQGDWSIKKVKVIKHRMVVYTTVFFVAVTITCVTHNVLFPLGEPVTPQSFVRVGSRTPATFARHIVGRKDAA